MCLREKQTFYKDRNAKVATKIFEVAYINFCEKNLRGEKNENRTII